MSGDYLKVEKAIAYIEDNFREQPKLQEVAEHVGLSPFHFHRLFRRWAGTSPKRFLQFLTIEHAKALLAEGRDVLGASYASGLSGPGRLHDLFVTIDAVTPGEFKKRGSGLEIAYGFHQSPFGECLLAATERGVCGLSFIGPGGRAEALSDLRARWERASLKEDPCSTGSLLGKIFGTARGDGRRSIDLFLKGTNFQIKVWEALLRVPPGLLCSYEDLAVEVCGPRAARAVGGAVAANPVAYIIPCHRVIRKVGAFGGYRWGPARKKAIVGWEAARRDSDGHDLLKPQAPQAL